MSLKWNGDAIKAKYAVAAQIGIDKTMSEAVIHAKQNHPGWKNVTGTAEGSIRIVQFAAPLGRAIRGLWGSAGVNYMIWLELKHGSALRRAGDGIYPRLLGHIKEALKRTGWIVRFDQELMLLKYRKSF